MKHPWRGAAFAVATGLGLTGPGVAVEFEKGELYGSWDTTVSYGAGWRIEERDDSLVGKVNLNPAVGLLSSAQQLQAPGRFSANTDDGNLNYDDGDLISNAVKITTELGFSWRNYGGFFRASAFYDFENEDRDELSDRAKDFVGSDARLLDAYLYANWELGEKPLSVRLGRQFVSWGESTFIQGGINVVNPVDVSKLRVAGAELKEAFLPSDMIWASLDITDQLSLEGLYMFEFENIDPDPAGTYFSTNDFGTPGGEFVMLGFGLADEGTPGLTVPRRFDRSPSDSGQFGLALRYYWPELNETEFGLYYLKYHSRLPLLSGISITTVSPESGRYFVEYPEDIDLLGLSFNTTVGTWALQGELSYRDDQPLQVDDVELLFAALSPLNALIPNPARRFTSQLGTFGVGQEIQGYQRHEVAQLQVTLTKLYGPSNPFRAQQIAVVGEVGMTHVLDLPDQSHLRYQGDGTDTGGGGSIAQGGSLINPVTQVEGFPTDFSWGYRVAARLDYSNAFGTPINVSPRVAFNHDVNGITPGPGGNFIEDRKSLTLGVGGNYLERWTGDIAYTRFFGAGAFNLLRDRDFLTFSIAYSF